jgi:hypothetical protein
MWELSFKNTLISSDFSILLRRPAVNKPQTEKIRSTNAWLAGAVTRSSAKDESNGYTARLWRQNDSASVTGAGLLRISMRYFDSSDCGPHAVAGGGAAASCFAARCFHFFIGGSTSTEPVVADGRASAMRDVSFKLAAACMHHKIDVL